MVSGLKRVAQSPAGARRAALWSAVAGLLIPSIAVGIRRLHDTDRSGWWQLLGLVPVLGWIALIVFYCQRGSAGPNRFG